MKGKGEPGTLKEKKKRRGKNKWMGKKTKWTENIKVREWKRLVSIINDHFEEVGLFGMCTNYTNSVRSLGCRGVVLVIQT